jgi:hypothetical protein
MRVPAGLAEYEEIVQVDDSDADPFIPENRSGSKYLKCYFNSASNKHNIRVDTAVGGEALPDGRAGDGMLLGLVL